MPRKKAAAKKPKARTQKTVPVKTVETGRLKIEPGIYPDVPFEEYLRWNAVDHSTLWHFRQTAAHARHRMTTDDPTAAKDMGRLVHLALLEPKRFRDEVVEGLGIDRRSNKNKALWEEFEKENAGKYVATQKEMEAVLGICASVSNHATARQLLYGPGVSELSIVWDDPDTHKRCKARLDRLVEIGGWAFAVDVKTTAYAATYRSCQRAIEMYAYDEQAGLYLSGLELLAPLTQGERRWAWIFLETNPPYCARVLEAEYETLQIGRDSAKRHLREYAECERTGQWPGWPEGMDLIGLPAWAMKLAAADM